MKQFEITKRLVEMIGNEQVKSLILLGEAGIGKSYTTEATLKKLNKEYKVAKSYATPLAIYKFLHTNNGKIIICEDLPSIWTNSISKGILLAALDTKEPRVVQYNSTSDKLDIPNEFTLTSPVIFLANSLPHDLQALAVTSRCLKYELTFNYEEKLEVLRAICQADYKDLTSTERLDILDFIEVNTDRFTPNFNFRILNKLYEIYLANKENWKGLAKTQIEHDTDLEVFKVVVKSEKSRSEQLKTFKLKTGLSRSKFYRYLHRYVELEWGDKNGIK